VVIIKINPEPHLNCRIQHGRKTAMIRPHHIAGPVPAILSQSFSPGPQNQASTKRGWNGADRSRHTVELTFYAKSSSVRD
jgi:hypothetical protein